MKILKALILIASTLLIGCSSSVIVKNCKHMGSEVYECEEL